MVEALLVERNAQIREARAAGDSVDFARMLEGDESVFVSTVGHGQSKGGGAGYESDEDMLDGFGSDWEEDVPSTNWFARAERASHTGVQLEELYFEESLMDIKSRVDAFETAHDAKFPLPVGTPLLRCATSFLLTHDASCTLAFSCRKWSRKRGLRWRANTSRDTGATRCTCVSWRRSYRLHTPASMTHVAQHCATWSREATTMREKCSNQEAVLSFRSYNCAAVIVGAPPGPSPRRRRTLPSSRPRPCSKKKLSQASNVNKSEESANKKGATSLTRNTVTSAIEYPAGADVDAVRKLLATEVTATLPNNARHRLHAIVMRLICARADWLRAPHKPLPSLSPYLLPLVSISHGLEGEP